MFDSVLDSEQGFGEHDGMNRSHVRRRRAAAIVALASVIALAAPAASALGGPSEPAASRRVVVTAGDSLWSIASNLDPSRDPREVVARLVDANALGDATIVPGQVLVLPDVG
jgi:LysM repeat protein